MDVGEMVGDVNPVDGKHYFYLHSLWADSRLVPQTYLNLCQYFYTVHP